MIQNPTMDAAKFARQFARIREQAKLAPKPETAKEEPCKSSPTRPA